MNEQCINIDLITYHQTREFFGIEDIDDLDPSFAGPREYHCTFFQEITSNLTTYLQLSTENLIACFRVPHALE